MFRKHDNIKEFKNGNISFRFSKEDIQGLTDGKFSVVECLSWLLEEIDCYFVGEEFCLSNWMMGVDIYNCYSDKIYTFPFDYERIESVLLTGKWFKLYARDLTDTDREIVESY